MKMKSNLRTQKNSTLMKIKEIISVLEEMAPLAYAEDFDNVGLLVGDQDSEATGILVCHDALESVIDESIAKNCNLNLISKTL